MGGRERMMQGLGGVRPAGEGKKGRRLQGGEDSHLSIL